ncbi:choloylglycine hydrolase, partial [Acinetobacter radioresistens]|nr:choloylglycine hydrolase [Acinetobacter radioresistens]
MFKKILGFSFLATALILQTSHACTRAVYLGNNDHIIT